MKTSLILLLFLTFTSFAQVVQDEQGNVRYHGKRSEAVWDNLYQKRVDTFKNKVEAHLNICQNSKKEDPLALDELGITFSGNIFDKGTFQRTLVLRRSYSIYSEAEIISSFYVTSATVSNHLYKNAKPITDCESFIRSLRSQMKFTRNISQHSLESEEIAASVGENYDYFYTNDDQKICDNFQKYKQCLQSKFKVIAATKLAEETISKCIKGDCLLGGLICNPLSNP